MASTPSQSAHKAHGYAHAVCASIFLRAVILFFARSPCLPEHRQYAAPRGRALPRRPSAGEKVLARR